MKFLCLPGQGIYLGAVLQASGLVSVSCFKKSRCLQYSTYNLALLPKKTFKCHFLRYGTVRDLQKRLSTNGDLKGGNIKPAVTDVLATRGQQPKAAKNSDAQYHHLIKMVQLACKQTAAYLHIQQRRRIVNSHSEFLVIQ